RDSPRTPNVLRAMVVETITGSTTPLTQDTVDVLETNVDDVSGEVIAHTITRLMDAGARDANAIPCIMKKGRPGYLVRVICTPETSAGLSELVARELGTLGIRCTPAVHRFIAERTIEEIEVEIAGQKRKMPVKCGWMNILNGERRKMPVKCGWIQGRVYTLKPEFEPARAWAAEMDLPVRDVLQAVTDAGWQAVLHRDGVRDGK
ncbi:MAG: DUF111 family protein, partial [Methanoregula sp.]|nr:DUF111 family protein [Methanoregula sp.]